MDRLEKYITAHREAFDDRNPDPAIWDRIIAQLPSSHGMGRRVMIWKWTAAAAVVFALVMCGVVAGMYLNKGIVHDPAYVEFMEAQKYYQAEYAQKKAELAQYVHDPEVDKDLQEMDRMFEELSAELHSASRPNKSELINAMIQGYRTRIDLLERILKKIEEGQNVKPSTLDDENVKI